MAHYQPGYYDCIIRDHGFSVSQKKQTPCIWFRFTPITAEGEGPIERETKLWITDSTIKYVLARLRDLGWEGNSFKELEPGGHSFAGTKMRLRCEHNDENYEVWEFPAPEGQRSENKEGVARKLDALFGKALKDGAVASQYSEPAAARDEQPFDDDDDVPF